MVQRRKEAKDPVKSAVEMKNDLCPPFVAAECDILNTPYHSRARGSSSLSSSSVNEDADKGFTLFYSLL